jgi:hypothetical protein
MQTLKDGVLGEIIRVKFNRPNQLAKVGLCAYFMLKRWTAEEYDRQNMRNYVSLVCVRLFTPAVLT